MTAATTIFHLQGQDPDAVEQALETIFAREDSPRVLRVEGTFSAVLARVLDPEPDASYRYLICRPHLDATWTLLLELGTRTVGLDDELSQALGGCAVFTIFEYGDIVAGYRLVRHATEVDRYLSDPTAFDVAGADDEPADAPATSAWDDERGHPERFADLLPVGTAPDDMRRVVLAPGWWDEHDATRQAAVPEAARVASDDDDDLVDERDRMRCIALALELWGPTDYPFTDELEDIPNKLVGPGLALAFA